LFDPQYQDNFRVTEGGIVKIIDLGLSREETVDHTGLTTTILPSYLFLAPELIIPDEDDVSMLVTKASDAYAYSMTALQVGVEIVLSAYARWLTGGIFA
jgi:serine/threonine protein kinase